MTGSQCIFEIFLTLKVSNKNPLWGLLLSFISPFLTPQWFPFTATFQPGMCCLISDLMGMASLAVFVSDLTVTVLTNQPVVRYCTYGCHIYFYKLFV